MQDFREEYFWTRNFIQFGQTGRSGTCFTAGHKQPILRRIMEELRIQMSAKGPYTIKGYKVVVVDSEGNEIEKEGTVALCRCGLSNKKPFCDGAHRNCETL